MLRSELIQKIQEKYTSLNANDIEKIIDLFFKKIFKSFEENQNIEIRGFGTFSKKINKAKKVRNPKTNEVISKEDTFKIHFKIGKTLHKIMNNENYSNNE